MDWERLGRIILVGVLRGVTQFVEEYNDSKRTVVHAKRLDYC